MRDTVRGINKALGNPRFTAIAVQPYGGYRGVVVLGYEGDGGEKDYYTQVLFPNDATLVYSNTTTGRNSIFNAIVNAAREGTCIVTGGHYCLSFQEAVADFNLRLSH